MPYIYLFNKPTHNAHLPLLFQLKVGKKKMVGISNESLTVFVLQSIPFFLGPLQDTPFVLLVNYHLIHFLGFNFLEKKK